MMVIDVNFKVILLCQVGNEYVNRYLPIIVATFKCNHDIRFFIGANGLDVTHYIIKDAAKDQKEFKI